MTAAPAHTSTPLLADWRRRYEVVGKLGSGGFADVYEAWDHEAGRPVALKVVDERRGLSARVVREVQAAASLSHPGIVGLYDFFSDGERSFIVWELVQGDPLAELIGELDDAEAVGVMVQVLEAVAHAHSQGIVHRDIKPQNIMLDDGGRAKVMDFGIARLVDADTLTADGDMLGTIAYMSPEQAAGRRVGPATDVYSAAVVLYELLGGMSPVRGATPAETISNIVAGRVVPLEDLRPDLPLPVVDAVDVALSPEPSERPPAPQLAAALRAVLAGGGLAARRPLLGRLTRPLTHRQQLAERLVGAALGAVTAAALVQRLPAYPPSWTLPLAVLSFAVWTVVPAAGLACLLGVLAFPLFNVSLPVGTVYLIAALVLLLATRRRPVAALWPALALLLAPLYGTLLVPAGAAVLGRARGPLTAAWAGALTWLYLSLSGVAGSPFAGFAPAGDLAKRVTAAGDPLSAFVRLAAALMSPPCLLQMALWAALAAGVGYAASLRRLEYRLWAWAVAFSLVFTVTSVPPAAFWRRAVTVGGLVSCVAVSGLVVLLALLPGPGRSRAAVGMRKVRGVQEDRTQA